MSLACPQCGKRLGRGEVIKFIRLATIYCVQCNSPLSIDKTGRLAIWHPVILAFLLSILFMKVTPYQPIMLILLLAGFVVGAFNGDKYGTLHLSSEDKEE
ncbi:MAG: hypothetical protein KOO63_09655 [Bacteroidales bacterium]|nr:hypothetical protein [Candidatus Latescibacterota bacterium]